MPQKRKFKNFKGMADVIQRMDDKSPAALAYPLVLFVCQEKNLPPVDCSIWNLLPKAHKIMLGEASQAWLVSAGLWPAGLEQSNQPGETG